MLRDRPPSPPDASLVGMMLGERYRVIRLLGHGGMASVYKAENTAIGRTVAVKVLHAHLADDRIAIARFQREARAAAQVGHENVIEVLDFGVDPSGAAFLVMEYVRGKSLAKLLATDGELAPSRAGFIAGQVLRALAAVHAEGIVHRDLKPENVLLTVRQGRADFVKVLDFGISTFSGEPVYGQASADLTPSGRTMATPFYASPEQVSGERGRDPRVDLYAVGVLLYEMLTGHRPFESASFPELCRQIAQDPPAPFAAFRKGLPGGLEAIVQRALSKRPEDRFATASDMLWALVPFGAEPPRTDEPEPTDTFTADLRALGEREAQQRASQRPAARVAPDGRVLHVVYGEILLGVLEYTKERFGERAEAVLGQAKGDLAEVLSLGIEPTEWYYGDALGELLEVLEQGAGGGDRRVCAEAGRYVARRVLSTRPSDASQLTPELWFSMAGDLFRRFFSAGTATVQKVGRGYGRFEVANLPRPTVGRAVAVVGYLEEALRLSGARDVEVRLARSAALGDGADVFEGSWSS